MYVEGLVIVIFVCLFDCLLFFFRNQGVLQQYLVERQTASKQKHISEFW